MSTDALLPGSLTSLEISDGFVEWPGGSLCEFDKIYSRTTALYF